MGWYFIHLEYLRLTEVLCFLDFILRRVKFPPVFTFFFLFLSFFSGFFSGSFSKSKSIKPLVKSLFDNDDVNGLLVIIGTLSVPFTSSLIILSSSVVLLVFEFNFGFFIFEIDKELDLDLDFELDFKSTFSKANSI